MVTGFKELGSLGRSQWGAIVNLGKDPALTGASGVREWQRMLKDPTAMLMYQVLALPVRTVRWQVLPGGVLPVDKEAADFAWDALTQVQGGWLALLSNVATQFKYGWSYHEMVLKKRADGRVGFAKIAIRPQATLLDWVYSPQGDLVGMEQVQAQGGAVVIPVGRAAHFRTTAENDDPEGLSIFYAAHRPWTYKTKLEQVEGIGLTRRWAGFPILTMPREASSIATAGETSDEARAERLIQAIYEDKMMGAYLPDGWALNFGGPQGGSVDQTMGDTIMRKDMEMARSILAQFLLLGLRDVGTQSLAGSLAQTFTASVEAFLNDIAGVFNAQVLPYLFSYNLFPGLSALPVLTHAPAATVDLAAVAQLLDAFTGAGVGWSDTPTVNFLRSLIPGMPPVLDDAGTAEAPEETPGAQERGEIERASLWRGETFGPGGGLDVGALTRLADRHKAGQTARLDALRRDVGTRLAALPPETTEPEARAIVDDLVLLALLAFRQRSVTDIGAAFWLGYGRDGGGGEVLPSLQREIGAADQWMGYGTGDRLVRVNPAGGATLFGDIAGQLEGQIGAILLLLKAGRTEEVFGLVDAAIGTATRGGTRGGLYAGNVWHAGWQGAVERAKYEGVPVRWVTDPLAQHCQTCARFGDQEYPSLAALLAVTGGILPGYGTECDGNCRCSLLALRGGVWVSL